GNTFVMGLWIMVLNKSEPRAPPQGSPLSPLLSNIILDELDTELSSRGHRFVRYADDASIYTKSNKSATRIMGNITSYIESTLKLKVNREKSKLGYEGFADYYYWRTTHQTTLF